VESDQLLDEVEELRLHDRRTVPPLLRAAIRRLQVRSGRSEGATAPATIRSAHEVVLSVQYRLMTTNPRNRTAGTHLGRAAGQSAVRRLGGGLHWKLMVLPAGAADTPAGRPEVELTLERAFDRWAYAQHHAAAAARDQSGARMAVARARLAWANYWELTEEAERLLGTRLVGSVRH